MRAVAVILMLLLGFGVSACGKSEPDKKPENKVEVKSETDQKVAFIKDVSGVWSEGSTLVSIIYQNGKLQFWIDNGQQNAKLGDIDVSNETLNLLLTSSDDAHEVIWTIKKQWNAEKTSYTLKLTNEEGYSEDLNFVRKIPNDDLNKFARLATQPQVPMDNDSDDTATDDTPQIDSAEAAKLASQYFFVSSDATSVDGMSGFYANQVSYYGKGDLSITAVMADKMQYYKALAKQKVRTSREDFGG